MFAEKKTAPSSLPLHQPSNLCSSIRVFAICIGTVTHSATPKSPSVVLALKNFSPQTSTKLFFPRVVCLPQGVFLVSRAAASMRRNASNPRKAV
jgi:hypothetical protein